MNPRRSRPHPAFLTFVVATVLLPAASSAAEAAASHDCIAVEVPGPMRLPDGSVHPAATLTLCDTLSLSPSVSLHRMLVDGRPIGMFRSSKRASEARGDALPLVVFTRDDEGTLTLRGCVVPNRGRSFAYTMATTQRSSDIRARGVGTMGTAAVATVARVAVRVPHGGR